MTVSWATKSVILVRPNWVEDQRGNKIPDYKNAGRVTIRGCDVQPGATAENVRLRDTTTVRWTVFMPPRAAIEPTDVIEFEGRLYEVDGHPQRWTSPTGIVSHVVVSLVDWKG